MKVVSENSEAEIARRRAQAETEEALAELAANILRVIRGAGKPHELPMQATRFVRGVLAHRDAGGDALAMPWVSALTVPRRYARVELTPEQHRERLAEEQTIRGALQMVAALLLDQRTQEATGSNEFYAGVMELEEIRAERRRLMRAAMRAASAPKTRSKRRVAAKRKPKSAPKGEGAA